MRFHWARALASLAILAMSATFTAPCIAGTEEDKAQARQLATDGVKAFDGGDWARAVSYFEAAEKLFHAPTHLLYIARGQAKLGKLVAARDNYRKIESEPLGPSASPAFKKAQLDAQEERQQLEQRIPTLVVRVEPRDVEGLEVLIDGKVIEGSELGGALVDPGRHRVEARAPGRTAEPIEIEVVLGEKRDVVLDFSFWSRRSRLAYRDLLRPLGVVPETIYLATPRAIALERMQARGHQHADDYALAADLAAEYFDHFEPPTADEGQLTVLGAAGPQ